MRPLHVVVSDDAVWRAGNFVAMDSRVLRVSRSGNLTIAKWPEHHQLLPVRSFEARNVAWCT